MSSVLRGFHQTSVDSRFVVTSQASAVANLFNLDGASQWAALPTNDPSYIIGADVVLGTVLIDLGYEVYVGSTQYRRVALAQDPTKYAHVRFLSGPAATPAALTISGLARI